MIHYGDPAKFDPSRFPVKSFVDLLDAKKLVPDVNTCLQTIRFDSKGFYSVESFGISAPYFLEFLKQKPGITFEDNQRTLQFLNQNGNSLVGFTEENWSRGIWGKMPGIPGIVFFCKAGGGDSHYRSAKATYGDLYDLFIFLQSHP